MGQRSSSPQVAHITEIERVLSGQVSTRDDVVVASWKRCVREHGLDPARSKPAYIVPDNQLRAHREQSERLISIARSGLENLFRQVAGQNYVLLLADRAGITVDYFGDPAFEDDLRRAGLYLGADWSEDLVGTCGVGACIATGQPMTIHQSDHFDVAHTPLSCTAAPIFDTGGNLSAVLDISLLRSPQPKASQHLALHLVTASVRRIELANLMATMRRDWVLRLAHSPEFLDVDPEAAIALDASGRIIGLTHDAASILGRADGKGLRAPSAYVGAPLSDFFDIGIDDLPALTRGRAAEDRIARLKDGSAIFCHAIAPTNLRQTARTSGHAIPAPLQQLCGDDAAMKALQLKAARLADEPLPILITGETGSGKERLARALHQSRKKAGPFVAVNCAAIPEALIEGELFGHAPGAFSGALSKGRPGLIEEANGGVLFLDEIGDMPLALQGRLLRVLSEGEVTRLGEARARPVRVKTISATNQDLAALLETGRFRHDLFYRVAAATLALPPLRARTDFEWLLDRLLAGLGDGRSRRPRLDPAARLALIRRDWPGNIRELVNVLNVAAAMCEDATITPDDLPDPGEHPPRETAPAAPPETMPRRPGAVTNASELAGVLAVCDGNISAAARHLGVDRTTVYRRMRRLGLRT
ncbi:sigma-54-dependent Fis family transcriptional regulator [Stappia sp. ES.058]|uniref:sigma-54-dependent Fis family transcriptional regulator n=1 Tax=Stappia sp. ES.058 TaxID=1881061 RepID=UPI00087BF930|nr:sigma-54-dependent Fis family transcriptional regulator [Stappia sp. ES.058]SDU46072.1 Transcriptional regulator of acetoin/glycerol metabolism [Stappia sp. ES.058]